MSVLHVCVVEHMTRVVFVPGNRSNPNEASAGKRLHKIFSRPYSCPYSPPHFLSLQELRQAGSTLGVPRAQAPYLEGAISVDLGHLLSFLLVRLKYQTHLLSRPFVAVSEVDNIVALLSLGVK